ncbi:hypothetical protein PROFUN_10517 [Planoprotostelium fungivorum]|uniref:Uncharacterized protein n=1 Tax=Planoprotostelium fungivorum TaxID=1890364 RepID=A0A2P6NDE3_9EUKA|nr:hypothetical protein PROFUN_10517 [Planoprotostelium fungivorum]
MANYTAPSVAPSSPLRSPSPPKKLKLVSPSPLRTSLRAADLQEMIKREKSSKISSAPTSRSTTPTRVRASSSSPSIHIQALNIEPTRTIPTSDPISTLPSFQSIPPHKSKTVLSTSSKLQKTLTEKDDSLLQIQNYTVSLVLFCLGSAIFLALAELFIASNTILILKPHVQTDPLAEPSQARGSK